MSLFCPETFSQRKKGKKESESHSDQGGNFAELKLALCAGRSGQVSAVLRGAGFVFIRKKFNPGRYIRALFCPFLFGKFCAYPFDFKFSIEFESEFNY